MLVRDPPIEEIARVLGREHREVRDKVVGGAQAVDLRSPTLSGEPRHKLAIRRRLVVQAHKDIQCRIRRGADQARKMEHAGQSR
jgi:hypothetical protein